MGLRRPDRPEREPRKKLAPRSGRGRCEANPKLRLSRHCRHHHNCQTSARPKPRSDRVTPPAAATSGALTYLRSRKAPVQTLRPTAHEPARNHTIDTEPAHKNPGGCHQTGLAATRPWPCPNRPDRKTRSWLARLRGRAHLRVGLLAAQRSRRECRLRRRSPRAEAKCRRGGPRGRTGGAPPCSQSSTAIRSSTRLNTSAPSARAAVAAIRR